MEGVSTAIEDHKADIDNKIKQLQVAISVKIVDNLKDLQNCIDQDMANFVNQTRAVSDRLKRQRRKSLYLNLTQPYFAWFWLSNRKRMWENGMSGRLV